MNMPTFATEHFFAQYEFNTPHLLACSDCESLTIGDLLELAGVSLDEFGRLHLGYTESQGDPDLRALVAAQTDPAISAEQVIVLGTPIEGIYLTARALLEPGDEVVTVQPAYDALRHVAEHIAGDIKIWRARGASDHWRFDLDELADLLTDRTKLLIVNFPHNPTGAHLDTSEWARLIALCRQHDVWLFSDEMYRGLELGGRQRLPSGASYEKGVALWGLSKTHGLPGLRAGWLVTPDAGLRAKLINWKHYTSICPPAPTETLAKVALSISDRLQRRNVAIVEQNLTLADQFFADYPHRFTWRRPRAGSVGLVGLKRDESAAAFCHWAAQAHGLLLLPAGCMGFEDNFVRFGFGRKSFPTALAQLEGVVRLQGYGKLEIEEA